MLQASRQAHRDRGEASSRVLGTDQGAGPGPSYFRPGTEPAAMVTNMGRELQGMCVANSDVSAGYGYWYQDFGNTGPAVCTEVDNAPWLTYFGTQTQFVFSQVMQWVALGTCVINLLFYAFNFFHAHTGWEEVYVCIVELTKVAIESQYEFNSPMIIYLASGNYLAYGRFAEWLLCCPVILIHMSNITGLNHEYNKRTMALLVSDLGCIVMGLTSAMSYSPIPKWVFFSAGALLGCITYYNAAVVYLEAYRELPEGICRHLVRAMAGCYYFAWSAFPILFVLGPEGSKVMNYYTSNTVHSFVDIIAKQVWGMLGHILRIKVQEHIAQHGPLKAHLSKELRAASSILQKLGAGDSMSDPAAVIAQKLAEIEKDTVHGNQILPFHDQVLRLESVPEMPQIPAGQVEEAIPVGEEKA